MKHSTIICIVGNSGSGKTELTKYMKDKYGIPYISSYTTRPMREGETDGVEHTFVDAESMPSNEEMIAYTLFGRFHYWATKEQVENYGICTYVIDEQGLIELQERFSTDYDIIKVYVNRPNTEGIDQDRKDRDRKRNALPEDYYDLYIENDYRCVEDFQKKAAEYIVHMLCERN